MGIGTKYFSDFMKHHAEKRTVGVTLILALKQLMSLIFKWYTS